VNIRFLTIISIVLSLMVLASCKSESKSNELIIYSSRNERFVQPLLEKFTQETGIRVQALHGAHPLRILEEARTPRADVFISNDLGALDYLYQKQLLVPALLGDSMIIDSQFRAPDYSYFALTLRGRGLIYNRAKISKEELPLTNEALMDPKWASIKGGFAITRGGNSGMIGHITSLRYQWGDAKTANWIAAMRKNAGGIFQGHSEVRRAVGAGEFAFGLVNDYYYHQQLLEPNNNVGFIYLDQGEGEMGALLNMAGLGIIKNGPNKQNAQRFAQWILQPENQKAFAGESMEILVHDQFLPHYPSAIQAKVANFNQIQKHSMPATHLGKYFEDTRQLIEAYGLNLDLR
jgi:iron(III) transport system substrate-binding protein